MAGTGLKVGPLDCSMADGAWGRASEYRIDFDCSEPVSKWSCSYCLCDNDGHGCHAHADIRNASSTYLNPSVRNLSSLNPLTDNDLDRVELINHQNAHGLRYPFLDQQRGGFTGGK